jgi:DNA-binding NarL/FixJ family response regulator
LLLDIAMPGRSGLDILRDIKLLAPKLPVLVLSAYSESQFGLRVLKGGAAGFLRKDSESAELLQAVKQVLAGKNYITDSLAQNLAVNLTAPADRSPHELLSDREYEVLRLIGTGKTVGQIAKTLALSVKTVSTYRTRILAKLHLKTTGELTYYAVKHGLAD